MHYGYEARTVLPSENGAVVEFANGARIAPTVILGAEGRMASAARRYVLGNLVVNQLQIGARYYFFSPI